MALPRPLQPVPQQHLLPLQPCLPTGRTVPGSSGDRAKRGGGHRVAETNGCIDDGWPTLGSMFPW